MKPEPFLYLIGRYATGGGVKDTPKVNPHDGLAYIGAGYWRLALWSGPAERLDAPLQYLHGVTLVNPDRSWDEIQAVELGIAILTSQEYVRLG